MNYASAALARSFWRWCVIHPLCRMVLCTVLSIAMTAAPPAAATCTNWPEWNSFKDRFMEKSGRIVDPSTPGRHTTSEGQSYGLFFALVANDQASFERILGWTVNNLAQGDMTRHLPAWVWGRRDDNTWGVIDRNSASDADLWIAYTLGEAGRIWQVEKYRKLAEQLALRILIEETVQLPGFGRTLLPGPIGFQLQTGVVRLNPSYVPIQLMRRFAVLYPQPEWQELAATSIDMIIRSSPRGFAPDWVMFSPDSGFSTDTETNGVGSYNAIRVYLWAGLLPPGEDVRPMLLRTLAPAARHVATQGTPALETDTRTGLATGAGPAGFSAAMLPFLASSSMEGAYRQQQRRLQTLAPLARSDNYYDQVLTLFAIGWINGHYHFARSGALRTKWKCGRN